MGNKNIVSYDKGCDCGVGFCGCLKESLSYTCPECGRFNKILILYCGEDEDGTIRTNCKSCSGEREIKWNDKIELLEVF